MMRALMLSIVLVSILGCSDDDSGPVGPDQADPQGNLVIRNMTGSRLVLFKGEDRLKVIPDDLGDYVVDVSNPDASQIDLRMYLYSEIENDLSTPDPEAAFKRWVVALASDNEVEHRSTWIVTNDEADTGTLNLSYTGGTDYSVDVYLNSQTGAKIASLRPGADGQQVGVDYAIYTMHYRYWTSDPNTSSGEELVGWKDTEVVNKEEVPIYVVLNESRQDRTLQIPHFDADRSPWGSIRIVNSSARPIRIWAGGELIEEVMYTDGSRANLSTISANESMTFSLQVGSYRLIAKDPQSNAEVTSTTLDVTEGMDVTWDLVNGTVTANIVINGVLPE